MGRRDIEGIYPLSPGQQGILFHTIEASEAAVYVGQTTCVLSGDLHLQAFERAWRHVIRRHGILRSAFVWENVEEPVQVVRREAELPLEIYDWRHLEESDRKARLERSLEEDRHRPFELRRAPLLRLKLVRLDDRTYHLVWSTHHLILDGWSKARVLAEVMEAYEALRREVSPPAPPTRPFADYLSWLQRRDGSAAEAFWRRQMEDFTEPSLLGDGARVSSNGAVGEFRQARQRLSQTLTEQLRRLAQSHRITLSSLVHVAWGLTLARECGRNDVVFGSVVSGRPEDLAGIEATVGMFINTLPVRFRFDPRETVTARARRFHDQLSEQLQFQETPLVKVAGWSGVRRGRLLFDHVLAFESYPVDEALRSNGGSLSVVDVSNAFRSNYPLMVTVDPGEELSLRLDFDVGRLEPTRVERMLRRFARVLKRAATRGEMSMGEAGALARPERHQLLMEWNPSVVPEGPESSLSAHLGRLGRETPDAVAVACAGVSVSFAELSRRVRIAAHRLHAAGVGPEARVAVLAERSPELWVGLLAVLHAGGAYVPLDPSHPTKRLEFMLEETAPEILLVSKSLRECVPEAFPGPAKLLEEIGRPGAVDPEAPELPEISPSHAAYVLYTSGSTGRPKGVVVSRRGLGLYVEWCLDRYLSTGGRGTLLHSSVGFDLTVTSLFPPLLAGQPVEVVQDDDVEALAQALLHRGGLSFLKLTPAHLEILGRLLPAEALAGRTKVLLVGGEALRAETLQPWRRWAPETDLVNEYGPTEAVVGCSLHRVSEGDPETGPVPIGRPFRHSILHVLDAHGDPVPLGTLGELVVGGAALARGYLARPAVTARSFVPDPFSETAGTRLYRTGDLARRRPNGELEFYGRLDEQVKVRGYRIEPGEIEAVLREHPSVSEARVLAREDRPGDRRLVAYVVVGQGAAPTTASLRQEASARLPGYMVPAAFVRLDEMPLTVHGKLDVGALPAPEIAGGGGRSPESPTEELVASIWKDVLGVDEIGAEDDFFDLGGHSLLATRVVSRLREIFDVRFPVSVLFEASTVEALAERIHDQGDEDRRPPLVPVPRSRPAPLSFAQQRLWFLDRLVPGNPFYNVYAPLRLTGEIRPAALRQSFAEVVRRHEALRTIFPEVDGDPAQKVLTDHTPPLRGVDLSGLLAKHREAELSRVSSREARRPFQLSRGPLLRTVLMRLEPRRHALLVNVSHVVFDGWSTGVLHREVTSLYEAFAAGHDSPLAELSIQYPDFAIWQRQWLQGDELEAQIEFWREYLADAPKALDLPLDRPRPAMETFRGAALGWRLSSSTTAQIESLSRQTGATLFMTLLAAWTALLRRQTGQSDILVGSPIANRMRRELEDLVGFFVNTLVLRTHLPGDPSFVDLVAQARRSCLAAYAHQDLPFERLVEAIDPERDLARNPLCHVLLALQNYPLHERRAGELTFEPLGQEARGTGTSKFDLTLYTWKESEELHGMLEYNLDIFDETTALRLVDQWLRTIAQITEHPERRLSQLELLSSAQRAQLLREWNDTDVTPPRASTLVELFEQQARRRPDGVAVVLDAAHLTWEELERQVHRQAGALRRRGVGVEARVGLAVDRSLELVPTLLAILKAGGAYVPLDRSYPTERLRFMIEDAGVGLILWDRELPPETVPETVEQVSIYELLSTADRLEAPSRSRAVDPEMLAYVMYTSGSTGLPKGVAVSHRAVMRLVWQANFASLGWDEVYLLLAPISFDASTLELWAPLARGGRLVISPARQSTANEIAAILTEQRVTTLWLTAGLFHLFVDEHLEGLEPVRQLLAGGDVLSPHRVRRALQRFPGLRLINGYGPTENTTFTACHPMVGIEALSGTVPIGRPISRTRVYLVDRQLELTLPGVPGELLAAGDGLARGYLGRPARTAERFVPDPFGELPGTRLYRTGDLVRHLPDGRLDFLGRLDQQVKIRGFRIEPGEIEMVLAEHPIVAESVVLARQDDSDERRLVAWVVPNRLQEEPASEASRAQQVAQWETIFDDLYEQDAADVDPTFNIVGWESHYTEAPIPKPEMREWLEDTVAGIVSQRPRRVLEIGCGTGMLLFRIAPRCERYVGTDISREALDFVRHHLQGRGEWASRVELQTGAADDLDAWPDDAFDTVILNSVIQYFPSGSYLASTLEQAARVVAPGGSIFVGDVRSLPLLEAYHVEVQLHRADPSLPLSELRRRAQRELLRENELLVAPAFFHQLARRSERLGAVEIHPKRGRAHNELTQFRYQVVLHVGSVPLETADWIDGGEENLSLERLRRRLVQERPERLAVAGLPNARVTRPVMARRLLFDAPGAPEAATVSSFLREVEAQRVAGIEPQDLVDLGEELGYRVELGWSRPDPEGDLEALFVRNPKDGTRQLGALPPVDVSAEAGDLAQYVNDPSRVSFAARVVPKLRRHLEDRLPSYMVPSAFVMLDALPLTDNGKIDRRALPAPEAGLAAERGRAPRTPVERRLVEIWEDVLGIEDVGVDQDFFELGGHSLLATRVASRIRGAFGVELPLRTLFEATTVAELARHMEPRITEEAPPLAPVPRRGPLPASFAQERLWLIDRLEGASPEYHMPVFFRLEGRLRGGVLRRALRETARRHESLRTSFSELDGRPVQVVDATPWLPLEVLDLSDFDPEERARHAEKVARSHALRPFDLETGPLARALLIRVAPREHLFALTLHHVISDGWSLGVLFDELARLLRAFMEGRPSPLEELDIQYPDFAVWQRQWLDEEVLQVQLDWWRDRLAGAPPELEMPTDRPRPQDPQPAGGSCALELSPRLSVDLHGLARRCEATDFQFLLAAFGVLSSQWTGQEDLVVGTPVANRRHEELEPLVGFFVNTLALRLDLSADPTFVELLDRVREVTLGAYDHQDLPFERLVAELAPERDRARQPVFQVVFQLEAPPSPSVELPALMLKPWLQERTVSPFDLTLRLVDGEDRISGLAEYRTALFDATTIRRLTRRFVRLLETIVADPDRPLRALTTLAPAESHQLLLEWGGWVEQETGGHLVERFLTQVRRQPDAVALDAGPVQVTYGELARRMWSVAEALRRAGARPETRVALLWSRGPERIAAILGILASGCVYVPLEPEYPADRLRWLLEDAEATLCLAETHLLARLPNAREMTVLGEDVLDHHLPETPSLRPSERGVIDGRALAYVMYTSGSTGRPKGVAVPHDAVSRLVETPGYADFASDRVFLHLAPAAFDASTLEIWGALLHGARLVIAPPGKQSLEDLGKIVEQHGVTTMWLTAGLFHQMVEAAPEGFAGVAELLAGGDVLSPTHVTKALGLLRHGRVINGYGPTENTTFTTCHGMTPDNVPEGTVPIGRPIPETRVQVLDRDLHSVPLGVVGELYAGGRGLARGYLGRPAQTAEAFVPDPQSGLFGSGHSGARLYRTGDRARWLPPGILEFWGRADHQVKIRGFRVEPGEVEGVLESLDDVLQAVVVVRGEGAENKHLTAYVVPAGRVSTEELAGRLEERLPAYMVPRYLLLLEALPLTPNGKVDRRALPEPETEGTAGRAPETVLEKALAKIWRDVLDVEQIGADQDFFALGGHSLSATRVVSRIRADLGREIPLSALFEHPTLEALARIVEARSKAQHPPLQRVSRGEPLPLSFAQERLWFLSRLEGASAAYHMPFVVWLEGDLRVEALRASLDELARRHEALRTTFPDRRGDPVQSISGSGSFPFLVVDLPPRLSESARETEAHQRCLEFMRKSFRLETGPLARALCLRVSPRRHLLALVLHHVISDGWSMDLLFAELGIGYRAAADGRASTLEEPDFQYADFAVWQRDWLSGETLAAETSWWRKRLQGAPAETTLPLDRPRPRTASYAGSGRRRRLDHALVGRLDSWIENRHVTRFQALLAVFGALLARFAGQAHVVVGTPVANRDRRELEDIVGFFVNTLALRLDLSGEPTFDEWLDHVVGVTLGAYDHQGFPFEKLVAEITPERDLTRQPLFQTMFQVETPKAPDAELLTDLRLKPWVGEHVTSAFDLTLVALHLEREQEIVLTAEYATALYDATTIDRFLGAYECFLHEAMAAPDRPVSEISVCSPGQRQQLLREWNDAPLPRSPRVAPHRRIEQWATRAPDRIALVDGYHHVSYSELAERARRVSRGLRARGVGPERRVGLLVERSAEAVMLILGVLRAGAAYVPLSTDGPAMRTGFQMTDAGLSLCVTDAAGLACAEAMDGDVSGVELVEKESLWAESQDRLPALEPEPESAAYVIYTSGTTGRPKGVVIPHRGPAAMFRAWEEAYRLGTEIRRSLQVASLTFDVFTGDWIRSLSSGGTLVLCPRETSLDAAQLVSLVERESIEALELVPAVLRSVLDHLSVRTRDALPTLRLLILGSDVWYVDEMERAARRLPGPARLVNTYGTTEGSIDSTWIECSGAWGSREAPVPGGRPFSGDRVWVVDRGMRPAPYGSPGEVWTGGLGLARGYVGRPAETAERFVPCPFPEQPGDRVYRTGDLGRVSPAGLLELLGRLDFQIQVRGVRVEPGEIEVALVEHPGVNRSAVVMRDERLVAYVTLTEKPGQGEEEEAGWEAQLRGHLEDRLPQAMVPATFIVLEEMPLTTHGKVDRKALPEAERVSRRRFVAPRTSVERTVAAVFADVLNAEQVGAEDDFFSLGGHSLLAVRVISRLREELGKELPLSTLFRRPSVRAVAAALEARLRDAVPPLAPVPRTERLPLSFAQERLWFLDRLEGASAAYHMPFVLRLDGTLRPGALQGALTEVVRRHESLRTCFPRHEGRPFQSIAPQASVPLSRMDLSSRRLPDELCATESRLQVGRFLERPFDLESGPLLRVLLVRVGRDRHLLAIVLHHVVFDGWSIDVFLQELVTLYRTAVQGRASPLPEPELQYADYAAWQRRWLRGESLAAELAWWRRHLDDAPVETTLPSDRPRPKTPSYAGRYRQRVLREDLMIRVEEFSREAKVTPFQTLLAVYAGLLARYSGRDDLVVGTPVAGRERRALEGMIGFFVNTLALRLDLRGEPSFEDLLERVRRRTLGAYDHQSLPFEKLVAEITPERDLARQPLFQTMFQADEQVARIETMAGLTITAWNETRRRTSAFDLTFMVLPEEDVTHLGAEYATALYDGTTIERFLRGYERLLTGMLEFPGRSIAEVPLLSHAETHQILDEWNDVGKPEAPGTSPHLLVERWSVRAPDRIAVVDGCRHVSYTELSNRARRVAHGLRTRGLGLESRLGLLVERSPEAVALILGALYAGVAYVPLSPDGPVARTSFQMADAGLSLCVADAAGRASWKAVEEDVSEIALVDQEVLLTRSQDPLPDREPEAESAAYVIYTSGTTGRPKGVVIAHRGLSRVFQGYEQAYRLGTEVHRHLQMASLTFDVFTGDWIRSLASGGTLVLCPRKTLLDAAALTRLFQDEDIEGAEFVPAVLRAVLDHLEAADETLPALRLLIASSDVWYSGEMDRAVARLPATTRVLNAYGVTEVTIDSTWLEGPVADRRRDAPIPIGYPLSGDRAWVVDGVLRPVPVGAPGELVLGGPGVARGYLGRPGLTADKFRPCSWTEVSGDRLYRTGDLARVLADGRLDLLGRVDFQVQVRGVRIEPGEIEVALMDHPNVERSVVVPRDGRLVAYVVLTEPTGETSKTSEVLRQHLRSRLPDPMIPASFVVLEAMPLTPHGKVDRQSLPSPGPALAAERVAPRTPLERDVAEVFEATLGLEDIGVHDDFFALGGHSLVAIRVLARLRRKLQTEVSLAALFEHPSVESLAAFLEEDRTSTAMLTRFDGSTTSRTATPLVLVHPTGGTVLCYADLARRLGTERAVWGLRSPFIDTGEAPESIEALAELYAEEVGSVLPSGPLRLGGWCFGGVVAYELARRLVALGRRVEHLWLIDAAVAPAPPSPPESFDEDLDLMAQFVLDLGIVVYDPQAVFQKLQSYPPGEERLRVGLRMLREQGLMPHDVSLDEWRRWLDVYRQHDRALRAYRPGSYEGRVLLIRATEDGAHSEPALGWAASVPGGVDVVDVATDHRGILDDPRTVDALRGRMTPRRVRRATGLVS